VELQNIQLPPEPPVLGKLSPAGRWRLVEKRDRVKAYDRLYQSCIVHQSCIVTAELRCTDEKYFISTRDTRWSLSKVMCFLGVDPLARFPE
jgi:hypothetical protein